jgi:SAM-dependent methyltransferase
MNTAFDDAAFKAGIRAQWDISATGWNAHSAIVRQWLAAATAAMIEIAEIGEGMRVLDVAAGSGDQTMDIANRVGPSGHVLATDLSPAILALAAQNLADAGFSNVETRVMDAEELELEDGSFDVALSRLGVMFCPAPQAAISAMHAALRQGGRACTLVFSGPQANPCAATLMQVALKHSGLPTADPFRPGSLFSLGKPGLIDDLFRKAGFAGVATTAISAPFALESAAKYLDFIRTSASPIQNILGRLDRAAQDAAWAEMETALHRFDHAGSWIGPNELLLTCGTRP